MEFRDCHKKEQLLMNENLQILNTAAELRIVKIVTDSTSSLLTTTFHIRVRILVVYLDQDCPCTTFLRIFFLADSAVQL